MIGLGFVKGSIAIRSGLDEDGTFDSEKKHSFVSVGLALGGGELEAV